MWAIMGGSGFENNPKYMVIRSCEVTTPFGLCVAVPQKLRIAEAETLYKLPQSRFNNFLNSVKL